MNSFPLVRNVLFARNILKPLTQRMWLFIILFLLRHNYTFAMQSCWKTFGGVCFLDADAQNLDKNDSSLQMQV